MMKMLRKRRKGGFTLIELIVVIAILGILAAIAIPRFSGITTNAETRSDQATARTIMSAVTMVEAFYSTNFNTATTGHLTKLNEYLDGITVEASAGAAGTKIWGINATGTSITKPGGGVVTP